MNNLFQELAEKHPTLTHTMGSNVISLEELNEYVNEFIAIAVQEEREACATLVEEEIPSLDGQICAEEIRARNK